MVKYAASTIFLLFVSASIASAQTVQGVVTGTVFDSSGSVLPKAGVTLTNTGTGIQQKATTALDGSYRFSLVPPGMYTLNVKADGFTEKQIADIKVDPSQTTPVNVTLSVATATATVEVEASDTLVQTATADLATTVSAKTIESMPLLSRNVFDLAFMAPAVTQGMNLNPASGGARESGTGYLLNGADNNDNFSEGGINITPPLESVSEFTVLANQMTAQYGRAAGAVVVSAIQKTGTNNFHGVGYEFNRNRSFNASDFFANRDGNPKPKYIRNQFGGEIDGPIVRNKTFFSFAFDRIDRRQVDLGIQSFQVLTPSELTAVTNGAGPLAKSYLQKYPQLTSTRLCPDQAANAPESIGHIGCVNVVSPLNTGTNFYFGRIDHNFSSQDRASVTVNFNRQLQTNLYGGGHPYQQPIPANYHDNYHHLALVETHVFSPQLINEFTVAHNRHLSDGLAGDGNLSDPEIAVDGLDYGGYGFGIGPYEGFNYSFTQDRWQMQDNLSWMKGKHTFKFGFGWQYGIVYRNWDLGGPGYYEFGNVLGKTAASYGYLQGDGSIFGDVDSTESNFQKDFPYFQELSVDPRSGKKADAYRHYTMKDANFFVQDDWKVSPRLTLNLGLRWEHYGAPGEVNGIIAQFTNLNCTSIDCVRNARVTPVDRMWKTRNTDFAPRFGFAWDVFGKGRMSLRGGYGISYDRIFDNVWSNGAWNPPFYGLLDFAADSGDRIFYTVPGSISQAAYVPNSLPGPAGRVSVRTMDVGMKDTSVQSFYLGVERQFLQNILVRANYQGSFGRHLPVLMNLNRYDGMRYNATFADRRPNSLYTGFNYRANNVTSNYNALVTELQKRFSRGLQFQFSYTWSKLMDIGSDLFTGESTQGSYSQPYYFVSNNATQLERGPGGFDHTHNYKFSFLWEVPLMKGQKGFLGRVLGGWQLSSFYQGYSGHPVEVYNGRTRSRSATLDPNGIGENLGGDYNFDNVLNDHPNFLGNSVEAAYSGKSPADGIFTDNNRIGCGFAGMRSTAAQVAACNRSFGVTSPNSLFVNPGGVGSRFGMLGRNVFRGPWFNGLNASLMKNFKMTEQVKLQFRFEAINVINHPNFDGIRTDLSSSQFGRAQILVGDAPARRLQMGVRVTF